MKNKNHPNCDYRSNRIKTTKYSALTFLPKNLFEQFHRFANLYFILVVALNWVPQVQAFGKEIAMIPVIFVLAVTAVKDAFEDFRRYKSDRKINHHTCRRYSSADGRYVKSEWMDVHAGDFVHLACDEIILRTFYYFIPVIPSEFVIWKPAIWMERPISNRGR